MKESKKKVIWITGGGSGIGRALALEAAKSGHILVLSGRREAPLKAVVSEISAVGGEASFVLCDVSQRADCDEAAQFIRDHYGVLDVAIANAGFAASGRFEQLKVEDFQRQFDVNIMGTIHTAQAALPLLKESKGRLVLISSVMGMLALPGQSAYTTSKFALRGLGLSLSQELSGTGVSCTTIYPGLVESQLGQVDRLGIYHPDKKDPRPKRFMWKADDAARVMWPKIWARKREYVFTWHGKIGAFLGRHAPGLVHLVLSRKVAQKAKRKTKA